MFCRNYMEDIHAGKRERVGFKFVGADWVNNWDYVDWAIEMSAPRTCIVVDNVVAKGVRWFHSQFLIRFLRTYLSNRSCN